MFHAACSKFNLRSFRGDVTVAFIQGGATELQRNVLAEPVPELAEALGLGPGDSVRLRKAVYGLVNAPRRWWQRVTTDLQSSGWVSCKYEPCVWRKTNERNELVGLMSCHVDDFEIGMDYTKPEAITEMEKIKALYRWGTWEHGTYINCGVQIFQYDNFEITISQARYAETIKEITVSKERRQRLSDKLTECELGQVRAVLGALQWLGVNTQPWLCSEISLAKGRETIGDGQLLLDDNKLRGKLDN